MVSTPCVLFFEPLTQWAEATLLSKFFTFDNLSEKNQLLRFVINNFIHKEDIRMRIFKKILTIILSIGLLVVISCGDKPTGSDSGVAKLPSSLEGKYYVQNNSSDNYYWWLYIKNGDIYEADSQGNTFNKKPNFTEDKKVSNLQLERENIYKAILNDGQMEYIYDFSDNSIVKLEIKQNGATKETRTFELRDENS